MMILNETLCSLWIIQKYFSVLRVIKDIITLPAVQHTVLCVGYYVLEGTTHTPSRDKY